MTDPVRTVEPMKGSPVVSFFLPATLLPPHPDLLDVERDWQALVRGEHVWITQTYLRLKGAGRPVVLTARPPADGILVFHAKHRRELLRGPSVAPEVVLVAVRSDSSDPLFADFELLQNGIFADGRRRHHITHWPQPGLQPRDPSRGCRVERAAYHGFAANLHPDLASPHWRALLEAEGVCWEDDSVDYSRRGVQALPERWHDFSAVDVVVALRPQASNRWSHKPATKLINAWHAGVPAILGEELAYRELRRSDLDYIEASSADDVLAAVRRLRDEPKLYAAMVENGRQRGREFTPDRILARWDEVLFRQIPRLAPEIRPWWAQRLSPRQRRLVNRLIKLIRRDPAR